MSLSFATRVTNFMLRWKVKPKRGEAFDVEKARAKLESLKIKAPPLPAGIECSPVDPVASAPAGEWLRPESHARTVIYFHGGGYFSCGLDTHRPVCAQLARRAKAQVYSVDYRLAPEHPFPAAVDDAASAYAQVLARGIAPGNIVLAGDSAGGGLALACMLEARGRGMPMPGGAVLFSPWTDLTLSGDTMQSMAKHDVMFRPEQFSAVVTAYLGDHPPDDPLASPLFADLHGLPPLMIWASEHEILCADATRLNAAALNQGVSSELHLRKKLPHVWPIMVGLPEAKAALDKSARFIVRCAGFATKPGKPDDVIYLPAA